MTGDSRGRIGRIVMAGVLALAWIAVWSDLRAFDDAYGSSGIPNEVIAGGLAMCAYAGALAWVFAPRHGRARHGGLAGVLMLASYIAGAVLISGGFEMGEGETVFSTLIELPFWLGVPLLVCGVLGAGGWVRGSTARDHGTPANASVLTSSDRVVRSCLIHGALSIKSGICRSPGAPARWASSPNGCSDGASTAYPFVRVIERRPRP